MLDRRVKSKGEAFMIPPASSSICPTLPKVDRHYVSSPQSWPWLCKSVRITCFKGTLRGTKKGQARRTFSQVKAQHPLFVGAFLLWNVGRTWQNLSFLWLPRLMCFAVRGYSYSLCIETLTPASDMIRAWQASSYFWAFCAVASKTWRSLRSSMSSVSQFLRGLHWRAVLCFFLTSMIMSICGMSFFCPIFSNQWANSWKRTCFTTCWLPVLVQTCK